MPHKNQDAYTAIIPSEASSPRTNDRSKDTLASLPWDMGHPDSFGPFVSNQLIDFNPK